MKEMPDFFFCLVHSLGNKWLLPLKSDPCISYEWNLRRLGFPLSALASMQEALSRTSSGSHQLFSQFRISLVGNHLWNSSNVKVSKSKKRRMRKKKCRRLLNDKPSVAEMMPVETTPEDQPFCEHRSSSPPSEYESTTSLDPELTLCHLNPELIISDT